jgi:aspartokinase
MHQAGGRFIQRAVLKGPIVVIVSAMSGVTNVLIKAAHQARDGQEAASSELARLLTEQHTAAIKALMQDEDTRASLTTETECIIRQACAICHGTALLGGLTPRS